MNLDDNTLTTMVDAAARGLYERTLTREGMTMVPFDDLSPLQKNQFRGMVLMVVWDAVGAMPDPRYAAWEEGKVAGESDAMYEERGSGPNPNYPHKNPYPAPEVAL